MAMNSAMDTTELLGGFEQVQHSVKKSGIQHGICQVGKVAWKLLVQQGDILTFDNHVFFQTLFLFTVISNIILLFHLVKLVLDKNNERVAWRGCNDF